MILNDAFNEIEQYTHFWNWSPDWEILRDIYEKYPKSYSVLTPFAYTYLEELIRSTTSEYGRELVDENGKPKKKRKVGVALIKLAINENETNKPELVKILIELKSYFQQSQSIDSGDNRNSTLHGYMHPKFWDEESFEQLIIDIAKLSKYYENPKSCSG